MNAFRGSLLFSSVLFGVLSGVGCSIADKTVFEDREGEIPETFFSDIRRGKTSRSWIESQLGEPETIQHGPDTQQIYNYRFAKVQKKEASLLVLLKYDGLEREQHYFHVLFEDSRVKKFWHDDYLQVQGDKYFKTNKQKSHKEPDVPELQQNSSAVLNVTDTSDDLSNGHKLAEETERIDNLEPSAAGSGGIVDRSQLPPEANKKPPPYPQMKTPAELWPR